MTSTAYDWFSNFKDLMNEKSDPRTKSLPFMDSPLPFTILSMCYLYFVCKVGPQYMKDRKPYNLKTIITIYNTFQISACACIIYLLMSSESFPLFVCDKKGQPLDPRKYSTAKIIWWTTMLKITEYLETVFFVLRKKQNQVSGLHLYHHISTLTIGWLTTKFAPGVEAVAPIIMNCFIHVLMYTYYLIALYGGQELQKKIIVWKRCLTMLQMIQFIIIIMHLFSSLVGHCAGSSIMICLSLLNIFVNYYMFYNFYKKTYNKIK